VIEDVRFPTVEDNGQIFGVSDFKITGYKNKNVLTVFSLSFRKAALVMRMCWESIYDLITGRYSVAAISGPVGISTAIGDAAKSGGVLSVMNIAVLISINLGFMNLLPIPALDGGRLSMILIEIVSGKRLPTKIEGIINGVGLALLLLLSLLIMVKDVIQIF
jgi:regulator of sigma E protease